MAKKIGRPSKYNEYVHDIILNLYRAGKTDEDIAGYVGVTARTVMAWRQNKPEFLQAVRESKVSANAMVEKSLFQKAMGYTIKETKVFFDAKSGEVVEHIVDKHIPPDNTAMIWWLKNRAPDLWRDKIEIEANVNVNTITDWLHAPEDDDDILDVTPERLQLEKPEDDIS